MGEIDDLLEFDEEELGKLASSLFSVDRRVVYVPMFEPMSSKEVASLHPDFRLVSVEIEVEDYYTLKVKFFPYSVSGKRVVFYIDMRSWDMPLDVDGKILEEIQKKVNSEEPETVYIYGPGIMNGVDKFVDAIKVPPGYVAFGSDHPYFMVKSPEEVASYEEYVGYVEKRLGEQLVGKEKVSAFVDILRSVKPRIAYREDEILGVFLIVGPPGTGKTLGAKLFSNITFGKGHFFRIDCGALPGGEIGRDDFIVSYLGVARSFANTLLGGYVFARAHRMSSGVLLLDEIEKAPDYLFKILLSILDEGMVRDMRDNTIDLRNYIVIMTSNLGQLDIFGGEVVNYDDPEVRREMFVSNVYRKIPPEIRSRIAKVFYFDLPTEEEKLKIAELEIDKYEKFIREYGGDFSDVKRRVLSEVKAKVLSSRDGREIERIVEKKLFEIFNFDLKATRGELELGEEK